MGKNLSRIGGWAFNGCNNLKTIRFLGNAPYLEGYTGISADFSSNFIITIQCYRNRAFETDFSNIDLFQIQYLSVPAPDIAVKNSQHYFGRIKIGKASSTITIQIRNAGTLPLKGIKIGNSGGDYRDFMIVSRPSQILAPGATSTFMVKFTPISKRKLGTFLEIRSNDPDEKITRVKLTGLGI